MPTPRLRPAVYTLLTRFESVAEADLNACATFGRLSVPISASVHLCVVLSTIGDITLTNHVVTDAPLGVSLPVNYPLPPAASVVITRGVFPPLRPIVVTGPLTNTVVVTSSTAIAAIGVMNGRGEKKGKGVDSHALITLNTG